MPSINEIHARYVNDPSDSNLNVFHSELLKIAKRSISTYHKYCVDPENLAQDFVLWMLFEDENKKPRKLDSFKGGYFEDGKPRTFDKWLGLTFKRQCIDLVREDYISGAKEFKDVAHKDNIYIKEESLRRYSQFKAPVKDAYDGYQVGSDQGITPSTTEEQVMLNEFLGSLSAVDRRIWELQEEGWNFEEIVPILFEAGIPLTADAIRYRFNKALAAAKEYLC